MIQQKLTLDDILVAKEERYHRQCAFKEKYELPFISITMNMPGAVKDTPILRRLRDYAVQQLRGILNIIGEEQINLVTGPVALLAVNGDGLLIKKTAVKIEEAYPFARLLDIDVFEATGTLLSRKDYGAGRGCFVCGADAAVCMREQKHTQADLQFAVGNMLNQFRAHETRTVTAKAEWLGALAVEAMLYEVTCTPAPGLVDRMNSGAHRDMDFYSFMASSAALVMPMIRCAQAGIMHEGSIELLLPVLRIVGLEGERVMLTATQGVNTQKGLVFLLGIMAGTAGWLTGKNREVTVETMLDSAAQMVAGIVERELMCTANKSQNALTAGERLYREYGITGIRGELESGLPAVRLQALPTLRDALADGLSINDALVQTLLVLMTCVDDTTVMHRHHPDKMRVWVRQQVQAVLAAGGMKTIEGKKKCEELDQQFIMHNVSPGGVADLLAVTWFLYRLDSTDSDKKV